MAKRFDTHNRFADEADTIPSRLDDLTLHRRLEERERRRAGWRRNLSIFAALIVAGLIAKMVGS